MRVVDHLAATESHFARRGSPFERIRNQHCVEICFLGRVLGGRIVAEYDIKFSNLSVAVLPDFFARCSTLHQTSAAENGVHQLERFQMVGDTHGQHVHEASAM